MSNRFCATSASERFEAMYSPDPNTGCWLWMGTSARGGYGSFSIKSDGKWHMVKAHRWSYEHSKGPIPEGLQVDHKCRVHSCVNPDHLEAVTQRENILRGEGPSAQQARQTHCKNGHALEGANLIRAALTAGHRECRTCTNKRVREQYRNERAVLGLPIRLGARKEAKAAGVIDLAERRDQLRLPRRRA